MKNVFDWNNFMECVDEVKPETCKPYETVLRHGKDPNKISWQYNSWIYFTNVPTLCRNQNVEVPQSKTFTRILSKKLKNKVTILQGCPIGWIDGKAGKDTPFIVLAGMGKAPFSYNFNIFLSSGTLKHVSSNWIIHKHTIINIDIFICIWFQKIIIVRNLVWTRIKMI